MAGSEIYKLAERMERTTKRELQKFKSANALHNLILPTSQGPQRPPPPSRASKRNAAQRTPIEKETGPKGGGARAPGEPGAEADDGTAYGEAESDKVSRNMKLEFVAKIKKLTNQGLTALVNKIKEVKAQSISDLPDDKI